MFEGLCDLSSYDTSDFETWKGTSSLSPGTGSREWKGTRGSSYAKDEDSETIS